tara:strand:- start:448 stop:849 length:402 start_codon:yes stop_codon:yes gene_type:complete
MGNSFEKKICCISDRKNKDVDESDESDDYNYFFKKSDISLKKERSDIKYEKKNNYTFFILYNGSTIATIIIIASGGPVSLAISGIIGLGCAVFYWLDIRKNIKDVSDIDYILETRKLENIVLKDNLLICKKKF